MPKHHLAKKLDLHGIFWPPNDPDKKFAGELKTLKGGSIILKSAAKHEPLTAANFGLAFGDSVDPEAVATLHGIAGGEPCTLLWLHKGNPGGFTDFKHLQSVTFDSYRVGIAILGLHIDSDKSNVLTSVVFSYEKLKKWWRPRFDWTTTDDATMFRFERNEPPLFTIHSGAIGADVSFDVRTSIRFDEGELRSNSEAIVEIKSNNPQSLVWFLNLGYRMMFFFEALVGTPIGICKIGVRRNNNVGWLRRKVRNKSLELDQSITVKIGAQELGAAAQAWLAMGQEFQGLEELIFNVVQRSALPDTAKLLSIAQALEAFHRIAVNDGKVSFLQRINELLSSLDSSYAQKLVGDPILFAKSMRDTRNFLTHPGISKPAGVVEGTKELFLFNERARAFLRFLVLRHTGLSTDPIEDPVFQQATKWR